MSEINQENVQYKKLFGSINKGYIGIWVMRIFEEKERI